MQIAKHIQTTWFCLHPDAFSHAAARLPLSRLWAWACIHPVYCFVKAVYLSSTRLNTPSWEVGSFRSLCGMQEHSNTGCFWGKWWFHWQHGILKRTRCSCSTGTSSNPRWFLVFVLSCILEQDVVKAMKRSPFWDWGEKCCQSNPLVRHVANVNKLWKRCAIEWLQ